MMNLITDNIFPEANTLPGGGQQRLAASLFHELSSHL